MCVNPIHLKNPNYNCLDNHKSVYTLGNEQLIVPCGKCAECRKEQSREWAFRICDEASLHKDNCFVTLTYAENPQSVIKRDVQLFIKRLRKHIEPVKVRYYCAGEYGDLRGRPHYHIILFGWKPDDLEFLKVTKRGENIYRSKTLESLWNLGFVSVGELTLESAKYTALYMQKMVKRPDGQAPPFALMSKSPGIGAAAFTEKMLETDKVYHGGQYVKVPRYYLTLAERQGFDIQPIKDLRARKQELFYRSRDEFVQAQNSEKKFMLDKTRVKC